jgi:phosphohistidine phosphatase
MSSRTLVLVRHAKADRPGGVIDFDRPLTPRGHADSGAVGAWLAHRGYGPDVVLCSPAKRTRQTWHGVALGIADAGADAEPAVAYDERLYDGDEADMLAAVREADAAAECVAVVGHNPTVSLLAGLLDPASGMDGDGLRTSGVAVHRFDGEWADLSPGGAELLETHTARG